ncbi:hypothetical protein HYW46_05110 [Candidatus Daviesbacteria bacterium]|nr:hypothetical protein [Candidatus Daviesbacteria bacterium]
MDESSEGALPAPGLEQAGEKLTPKEKVTKALQEGLSIFEADVAAKPDQGSQETKNQLAEIAEAKRKLENLENSGDGTDTVELRDEKGKVIKTQKEGIPVYEMLQHLENKLKTLPESSQQAKELRAIIYTLTLKKHTRDYLDLPYRWVPKYYQARVREEIARIKSDGRSTGDALEDEKLAWAAIAKRRELFTPPQGKPPNPEDLRFTIALINIDDDAKKVAREEAGEYVREQLVVKHKLNPREWFRAIKFRLGEEYQKYKGALKIQAAQVENGQYFCSLDAATGAAREINEGRAAMVKQGTATAERFALAARGKTEIHHEEESESFADKEVKKQISGILTRFAKSEITEEQFGVEKDALVKALKENPNIAPYIQDAKFVGDNLLEVARRIKLSYERGQQGLKNLDRLLDIQLGRAMMAASTEADYSRIEQVMNRLQGASGGFIVNPLTLGIMFGAAGYTSSVLGAGAKWASGITLAGAPIGAIFAGWRRWTDLKRDRELAERDATYSRAGGDKRRQKLEDYRVNRVEGGGRVTAAGLLSEMASLTSADLSAETAQDRLFAKIAEINARINYGLENKVDLMVFEGRLGTESEKLKLVLAQVEAIEKLKKDGKLTDADIKAKLNEETGRFLGRFQETREEQDKRFDKFRRIEALKAAGFGLATGLGGGLLGQEAGALVKRAMGLTTGSTLLEDMLKGAQQVIRPGNEQAGTGLAAAAAGRAVAAEAAEKAAGGAKRAAGFAIDQAKEGFAHPDQLHQGAIFINENLRMDVDPAITDGVRHITFHDGAGNLIPTGPARLTPEGTIVVSGDMPDSVRSVLSGFESHITHNPNLNIRDGLMDWFKNPSARETFQFGDLTVDINPPNPGETIYRSSMTLYEGTPNAIRVHGIIKHIAGQPVFNIDSANPGNTGLNQQQLGELRSALGRDGWAVQVDHVDAIPSKGTVVDALLGQKPDVLKAKGIIETGQFDKTWNNHVLRPDIVSATGMHTHNELTLHLGGEYQVLTDAGAVARTGVGNPGEINFGGELTSGRIESHLFGAPPQVDPELAGALARNNGLKLSDLVAVVDTTDGRQIMLPLDGSGNVKLPAEFFDAQTGGLHGVKDIAAVYLQKPDGGLLPAKELLDSGQIPTGSVVHSLAAEKFVETPPPSLPPTPAHDIYRLTPPEAREFIPPPPMMEPPTPPPPEPPTPPASPPPAPEEQFETFFTTPFGRRFPLGPRKRTPDRKTPPPYGPYGTYENLSPKDKEFYRNRLSERLRQNPDANLDATEEVSDYFRREDPAYLAEFEAYLNQPEMLEPMDDNCEAIVCLPVYTLGEGKIIQHTLEQYLLQVDASKNQQSVDPRKLELVIFLNYPKPALDQIEESLGHSIGEGAEARVRAGNPEKYDTEEVIKQFMEAHPELRIRVMKKEFDQRPVWGRIIKTLYDAAILRSSRRKNARTKDPVIITNDIDVVNLTPAYIRNILNEVESNDQSVNQNPQRRKIDGWVGKIDMPNHGYKRFPGFLLAERMFQFLDAQNRHKPGGYTITQGRNSILRSSTYAAIGGVNENTDAGADTELGRMVNYARNNPKTIQYLNSAWLESDPRRELSRWLQGIPLCWAWDTWGDLSLYGDKPEERFDNPPEDPSKVDKDFLERELYFELQRLGLNPESDEISRTLHWLGFKPEDYHIGMRTIKTPWDPNKRQEVRTIIVDNLDNVIQNLQNFIIEKRWEKTGKKIEATLRRAEDIPTTETPLIQSGENQQSRLSQIRNKISAINQRLAALPAQGGTEMVRLASEMSALAREQARLISENARRAATAPRQAAGRAAAGVRNAAENLATAAETTIATAVTNIQTSVDNLTNRIRNLPTPTLPNRDAIAHQLQILGTEIKTLGNNIPQIITQAQARINAVVQMIPPIPTPDLTNLRAELDTLNRQIQNLARQGARNTRAGLTSLQQTFQTSPEQQAVQALRNLNRELLLASETLRREQENGEAKLSKVYPTGGKFLWQEVTYGPDRRLDGDHCFRGYLMIEPEDMPKVLSILTRVGRARKTQGKSLDFKWLLNTWDKTYNYDPSNVGRYALEPTDPRIALYADSTQQIREVLSVLAANPEWQAIEQRRIDKMGGRLENAPRRPGTNAYIDTTGREWRSLNFNDQPGYSEDEAHDPD